MVELRERERNDISLVFLSFKKLKNFSFSYPRIRERNARIWILCSHEIYNSCVLQIILCHVPYCLCPHDKSTPGLCGGDMSLVIKSYPLRRIDAFGCHRFKSNAGKLRVCVCVCVCVCVRESIL